MQTKTAVLIDLWHYLFISC